MPMHTRNKNEWDHWLFPLHRLERGIEKAQSQSCDSLLVLINTPGGSLPSTTKNCRIYPKLTYSILCLVYPSGGHAGSAGAIILQACHVAGAMEATNIGAATPISGSGKEIPKDLRKKLLNDTRSWLEGLTKLRKRSEQFGKDIITEAKAVFSQRGSRIKSYRLCCLEKVGVSRLCTGPPGSPIRWQRSSRRSWPPCYIQGKSQ